MPGCLLTQTASCGVASAWKVYDRNLKHSKTTLLLSKNSSNSSVNIYSLLKKKQTKYSYLFPAKSYD